MAYAKPEITNYNIQISNKIKRQLFGILDFGHYNLFGICVLLFGIFFIAETWTPKPETLRSLQLVVRKILKKA